ncbi:hypothetical protein BLA29_002558 [Euroglyphus maynei]|uniref:WH2 domain-containing protein n=1 Tax=Euroglyphus maynei TaxID=6958 RepID=A0A1Y3B878_EURMA|nr:hypothetical protein BLA29_002558 [Euroglyphus maynei]
MKNQIINQSGPLVVVSDWQQRSSSSSSTSNNKNEIKISENIDEQVEVALNELNETLEQCAAANTFYDDDINKLPSSTNNSRMNSDGQRKTTEPGTAKVVIKSMYDNNNNGINRLSSSSFSVRDGIRKFNTINETNVSQQDLSSLRSTMNPLIRRSTSKLCQDDREQTPKVNRKLENFQIGSFVECHPTVDIYEVKKPMTNVVRTNNKTKGLSTVITINSTKPNAPIINNGNTKTLPSSPISNDVINNNDGKQNYNNRSSANYMPNNAINKNDKITLSKQHSNGFATSSSATDFLKELKMKSKTWSHRNAMDAAYDEVDNQKFQPGQMNSSVFSTPAPIPPPPPPPPPPASQPIVPLTQSVNRMVTSQTLFAPKGWNQSSSTRPNKIRSPMRSVSMEKSSGDSRCALLNEIKNFHNNSRLKKVTNNQPFSLKIYNE